MRLFYGLRYSLLCKLIIETGRLIMCLMSVMSITDCFNDRLWWCISTEMKRVRINAGDLIDAYRRYHGQVQTFLLLLLCFYTFLVDQPIDPLFKNHENIGRAGEEQFVIDACAITKRAVVVATTQSKHMLFPFTDDMKEETKSSNRYKIIRF